MTEQDSTDDSTTQAELMDRLMEAYDVPIDLIRYDTTHRQTHGKGLYHQG